MGKREDEEEEEEEQTAIVKTRPLSLSSINAISVQPRSAARSAVKTCEKQERGAVEWGGGGAAAAASAASSWCVRGMTFKIRRVSSESVERVKSSY